jgi:hypothetical protein
MHEYLFNKHIARVIPVREHFLARRIPDHQQSSSEDVP